MAYQPWWVCYKDIPLSNVLQGKLLTPEEETKKIGLCLYNSPKDVEKGFPKDTQLKSGMGVSSTTKKGETIKGNIYEDLPTCQTHCLKEDEVLTLTQRENPPGLSINASWPRYPISGRPITLMKDFCKITANQKTCKNRIFLPVIRLPALYVHNQLLYREEF